MSGLTQKKIRCVLLIVPFFFLLFCKQDRTNTESMPYDFDNTEKRNHIILEVQESFYSNFDFDNYILHVVGEDYMSLPPITLSRIFDNFVEEKILLQDVLNRGILLTQTEKKNYLAKLSHQYKGENMQDITPDAEHEFGFEKLLVEKLTVSLVRDIAVSDEEIKAYYEENKREFLRPELVKVSQILLDAEDKAIDVLEKIKDATEEDFRSVARDVSVGVEASRGGELGIFELGQLPFEMEKVIFSLEEGRTSQVVESSYGYHIFRLDQKYEPELVSEEQAAPQIEIKILERKIKNFMSGYVQDLGTKLTWMAYPENLPFPYQRNNHD